VHEELQRRVAALVADDVGSFDRLVEALRRAPLDAVAECAAHEDTDVRHATAEALALDARADAVAVAAKLATDPSGRVRLSIACGLRRAPSWALPHAARAALLADDDSDIRSAAAAGCSGLAAFTVALCEILADDFAWDARLAAGEALEEAPNGKIALAALVTALGTDSDRDVSRACARSAEVILERCRGWPKDAPLPRPSPIGAARERLEDLDPARHPRLAAWLKERTMHDIDREKLASFGTDLTTEAEAGRLPRAFGVKAPVAAVLRCVRGAGSRSAVLLGPAGVGKSAIIHEVVHALRADGWRVLRLTPGDFLAGTVYLGEWETKLKNLVQAIRAPKRVLLVVPDIADLATAGTTSKSDRNVASMLAPHLERGEIALLGETTPEAFRTAHALQRLFTAIEVAPATHAETRALLAQVAAEARAEVESETLDRLMDLTDFYLPGVALPGRALGLLRRVLEAHGGGALTPRDILGTITESTGVPAEFLDDEVPLDLARTRDFFEARVMGQPDAIAAVLDLVTLIKAGLTDPERPCGVLLFVGPTGVGKTELARALAELLFGDAARLHRFDMSEYANYAAYERLNGSEGRPGTLTRTVQQQPFSVILLDEIEKAHGNVFDLCLQVFDAGRLTDGQGRTADFRRSIVILTSNIGSAVRTEAGVGFLGAVPPPPDRETILRELARSFRPEFLNRIDKILTFRPLALETAEKIARRELAKVIERGGLARRRIAVDLDPKLLSLLLRHGYSPAFGARPLKRTVESLVLLPLARVLASGDAKPGSVLRLGVRGDGVAVEIVSPEEEGEGSGEGESADLAHVRARIAALHTKAAIAEARKSHLLARANAPGFWDDRPSATRDLDEVHRLDALLEALRDLEEGVALTAGNPDPKRAAEFVARHDREAKRLDFLLSCGDLDDAIVTVTLVKAQGRSIDGVAQLAAMYKGLAERRGLDCTVLDDRRGGEDTITLSIEGAGAHALLRTEAGLHQISRPLGADRKMTDRATVRVEVLRAPHDEGPFPKAEVRIESKPLRDTKGRMLPRPRTELSLLHLPTLVSVHAWSEAPADEAVRLLHPLLRARVLAHGDLPPAPPHIIRRYRLGPSPVVRDRRTGLSTGRADQVLKGEIDLFLGPSQAR